MPKGSPGDDDFDRMRGKQRIYGIDPVTDKPIKPPYGWSLLPAGQAIPQKHRECITGYNRYMKRHRTLWCDERRCHSTMTPHTAQIWGDVVAFAIPNSYYEDSRLPPDKCIGLR